MNNEGNIDVHYIILSHLPTSDYLRARELNRYFNKLVCNNPFAMRRVVKTHKYQMPNTFVTHVRHLYFYIPDYITSDTNYEDESQILLNNAESIASIRVPYFDDNSCITKFTNLTRLHISQTNKQVILDSFVKYFPYVTTLKMNCRGNKYSIPLFSNLTTLKLENTEKESVLGISTLTKLTKLKIIDADYLADDDIRCLTNITCSKLQNTSITNYGIELMTNIDELHFTGDNIKHLNDFPNLTKLVYGHTGDIDLNALPCPEKMIELETFGNSTKDINKLINIRKLNLSFNTMLQYNGFSGLVNITDLDLSDNLIVEDNGLKNMTGLRRLSLYRNTRITNNGIKHLTGLTELDLYKNKVITDEGITQLLMLTDLDISSNKCISYGAIKKLTNITKLDISFKSLFTDAQVSRMIHLKELLFDENNNVTDMGIKNLTGLTELSFFGCEKITYDGISKLTNIRKLNLDPECIPNHFINQFTTLCFGATGIVLKIDYWA